MRKLEQKEEANNLDSLDSKKDDVVKCEVCGCKYLELITVSQYKKDHAIILGQRPPVLNAGMFFYLLKCPKCNELYEPVNVYTGSQNKLRKDYDEFLDTMEKPLRNKKDHTIFGENV
jgi:hypothetical protein